MKGQNTIELIKNAFYVIDVIDERYFRDFPDPYLKGNKDGSRPHYYCFEDRNFKGIYWLIPMSSKVEKYKAILRKKIKEKGTCDTIHICKIDENTESVFLIQDMIPVTEEYIKRTYEMKGEHGFLKDEKNAAEIERKAKIVKVLVGKGIKFSKTQADVMKIYNVLVSEK